jgi:5-methylthioadenosine/S-adenosylhomocysteine deaminase
MYYHLDAYAKANIDCGFRTAICCAVGASNPDWKSAERGYVHFNSLDPLISYKLGFHAEYTADDALLRYLSELSHAFKAPV